MNLYDHLVQYSSSGYYPMHMPGHKRNSDFLSMQNPYTLDITEIEGFDNLHHPEGILDEGMQRAADLYGSEHTDYLVGGSTAGILAGIAACTKKGDKILVARNSHKSVYHAIYLNDLIPIYLYPQRESVFGINGGISPRNIEEMLIKHPDIKAVVITSPTYEGVLSDIASICQIVHRYRIPILVDEAHGAHLGFHSGWPKNSIQAKADIVIHSLHKTLPAFTQTGLLHVNSRLVDYEEVKRYLGIYQTSSPSYILMAGIEQCISLLERKRGELFTLYEERLQLFYERMICLKHLRILTLNEVKNADGYGFDPSKITISVKEAEINGNQLYNQLLEQYKIQMEMVSSDYVLGITSICDTEEGFQRLGDALLEIDANVKYNNNKKSEYSCRTPNVIMSIHEAYEESRESVTLKNSTGRIAAEYVYLYPPGIPLLVPGERISNALIEDINTYKRNGLSLQGMLDKNSDYIRVVMER